DWSSDVCSSDLRKFSDTPLHTFSVSFDNPEFDESRYQKDVIRHLKTDHEDVRSKPCEIARDLPDVIWHTEKTVLRTAPVPMFHLSKLVRSKGYKVALTGEGSDE